jgi:hypothetical protein
MIGVSVTVAHDFFGVTDHCQAVSDLSQLLSFVDQNFISE